MSILVTRSKLYQRDTPVNVPVSGHKAFVDAKSVNGFGSGASGERNLFAEEWDSRIRQGGTAVGIKIEGGASFTSVTSMEPTIWRLDGATYDRVTIAEDILPSLTVDTITTVIFSTPITGILEGDHLGIKILSSGSTANVIAASSGDGRSVDGSIATTNFDWGAQTSNPNYLRAQLIMENPIVSCIGTSHTSGHNQHDSYVEDGTDDDPTKAYPSKLGTLYGIPIQNMGAGGAINQSSHGLARFDDDITAIKPRFCLIDYGTADITNSIDEVVFTKNVEAMRNRCNANDITPIILSIPPRTDLTNAQHETRVKFNSLLKTLVSDAQYIDREATLGQNRSSGPTGNLWDIQTALKDADDIHFLEGGYTAIAALIKTHMDIHFTEKLEVNSNTIMTTSQRTAILSPPEGVAFYDTTLNKGVRRTASAWETVTSS